MSENEIKRPIHLVFQVLNFLTSPESNKYNLLAIDKWILTVLSKHNGHFGIFPSQATLAKETNVSLRYIQLRLKHLESIGLILIKKVRRHNHYTLNFLSTIGEPQFTYHDSIGEPQFVSQVNHSSPHRRTTVHPNNIFNNPTNKTERARTKRVPLPPSWKPDQTMINKAREVAQKTNKSVDELISKFKNLQRSKEATSAYWQGEFENFLMNERPSEWFGGTGQRNGSAANEVRSMVREWGPGHPDYDRLNEGGTTVHLCAPIRPPMDQSKVDEGLARMKADAERIRQRKAQGDVTNGTSRNREGGSIGATT